MPAIKHLQAFVLLGYGRVWSGLVAGGACLQYLINWRPTTITKHILGGYSVKETSCYFCCARNRILPSESTIWFTVCLTITLLGLLLKEGLHCACMEYGDRIFIQHIISKFLASSTASMYSHSFTCLEHMPRGRVWWWKEVEEKKWRVKTWRDLIQGEMCDALRISPQTL